MKIRGVKLTPSILGISFGVWLLVMSGAAGFYVPNGPSKRVESAAPGKATGTPVAASSATATGTPVVASSAAATAGAKVAASSGPGLTPTALPTPPPSPTPTAVPAPTSTPAPYVIYTIEQGDTLSEIADRHGVSEDSIVRYNNLSSPDDLHIGDKITIPIQSSPGPSSPAPMAAPAAEPNPIHTVKPGDTLFEIAESYGVSADSIIRYNGLDSPDDMQVGDRITIPLR